MMVNSNIVDGEQYKFQIALGNGVVVDGIVMMQVVMMAQNDSALQKRQGDSLSYDDSRIQVALAERKC